jgi:hypothetical protein
MPKPRRLDLAAIEATLRTVQARFADINAMLTTPRDPLSDQVLEQMLLGYRHVDWLLAQRIDPFALGNSRELLELNFLVLCGRDAAARAECARLIQATETHFYSHSDGGIESLILKVRSLAGEPVWRRAAAAYIQILSRPQLFFEGNHRTGALVMSWMLAADGKPPFVLSVENAKAYFEPSTLVKNARKHTPAMLLRRRRLVKRFADLLKAEQGDGQCSEMAAAFE